MGERHVIRKGVPTTTGGRVLAGSPSLEIEYAAAARLSDPMQYGVCGVIGQIAERNPTWLVAGQFSTLINEVSVGPEWAPPAQVSGSTRTRATKTNYQGRFAPCAKGI